MLSRTEAVEAIREAAETWRTESKLAHHGAGAQAIFAGDAIDLRLISDLIEEEADLAAVRLFWKLTNTVRSTVGQDVRKFMQSIDSMWGEVG